MRYKANKQIYINQNISTIVKLVLDFIAELNKSDSISERELSKPDTKPELRSMNLHQS